MLNIISALKPLINIKYIGKPLSLPETEWWPKSHIYALLLCRKRIPEWRGLPSVLSPLRIWPQAIPSFAVFHRKSEMDWFCYLRVINIEQFNENAGGQVNAWLWLLATWQKQFLNNLATLFYNLCFPLFEFKNMIPHRADIITLKKCCHLLKNYVCKTTSPYNYAVALRCWLGNISVQVNLAGIYMNYTFICSESVICTFKNLFVQCSNSSTLSLSLGFS